MSISGIRGIFFDFTDDPWKHPGNEQVAARFFPDGLLVIENGRIKDHGDFATVSPRYPGLDITHLPDRLILPGFIDGHIHFPQTRIIGSYGEQLLPWLEKWVFPEEIKYKDRGYAEKGAGIFFDSLLASGTTTCQAFTTSSPVSSEVFFEEAAARNMRVIAGLTGIDRMAPPEYLDTADHFYRDSKELIARYHGQGRNLYAITPRFAFGASDALLDACARLKREHPDCWVNTHISENPAECREVLRQRPDCVDYLAIYEKHGLVGPKFTGGHGVYLTNDEFRRMSRSGAAVCFCPCSNLFLGSGFFRIGKATDPEQRVKMSFGSDIGGGNRFSLLHVLDEAYKVGMHNSTLLGEDPASDPCEASRNKISPYRGFWSITLGGAEALHLDGWIGNFDCGKEADFVVLDWNAGSAAQAWHQSLHLGEDATPRTVEMAADLLFGIMMAGDDRNVSETWIMGERVYQRES